MSNVPPRSKLTGLGILFSVLMVLGLIGLGAFVVVRQFFIATAGGDKDGGTRVVTTAGGGGGKGGGGALGFDAGKLAETQLKGPKLGNSGVYVPKDNVVDIELSEYAGYAGLIAANGGLEPNENSFFAKNCGFKVRIKLSEEEIGRAHV